MVIWCQWRTVSALLITVLIAVIVATVPTAWAEDLIIVDSQLITEVQILNIETISLQENISGVTVSNTVDPTGQSVNGAALGTMTASLHRIISQRLAHKKRVKPVQLPTTTLEPGMLLQARAPQAWSEVFGVHRSRGAEGQMLAHEHDYYGFTGGYETDHDKALIGIIGGFAQSNIETGSISIESDTDSFFAGGYGHFYLGSVNLTTTLIGGYEEHDDDRLVFDNTSGFETVSSKLDSFFLSPSLTLSAAHDLGGNIELRPSASIIYGIAWFDGYRETGTTATNLVVDSRAVQAITTRLQLAAAQSFGEDIEFEVLVGSTSRYTDEDDIRANLSGTDFSYTPSSDDSVYGVYAGANLRVAIQDHLSVVADMEYGRASGNEYQIDVNLGLEYNF